MPGCHTTAGRVRRSPERWLLLAIVAILTAALQTPNGDAVAQVSSDGDMFPINVSMLDAKGRSWTAKGHGAVWNLGSKSATLATLVVTGRTPGELEPDTEYQSFSDDLHSQLKAVWRQKGPLYFRPVEPPRWGPGRVDLRFDDLRKSPRAFRIDPKASHLVADAAAGRYLFHMQSRSRGPGGARIDHYLVVDVTGGGVPVLDWFIDAGDEPDRDAHFSLRDIDRRWAVSPAGPDPGRLTPVREALGYRMIPAWQG